MFKRFILNTKYYFKDQKNRIPPYMYEYFCSEISKIEDLKSITMSEYLKLKDLSDSKYFILRHDIDHDPWTAEKMAIIENIYNIKSTYFILHTARYFKTNRKEIVKICKNIQSLGHEIGLHNDLITDYFINNQDPKNNLSNLLNFFKDEGVIINGSASHGSKFIQSLREFDDSNNLKSLANFHVFSEIYNKKRLIKQNALRLKFEDKKLNIPCLNMKDFGLKYESYFIPFDKYISDAGRKFWATGNDPIIEAKQINHNCTIQCLIHPVWWKYYLN